MVTFRECWRDDDWIDPSNTRESRLLGVEVGRQALTRLKWGESAELSVQCESTRQALSQAVGSLADLPSDCWLVGYYLEWPRDAVVLVYYHESFPVVPEGALIPSTRETFQIHGNGEWQVRFARVD